MIAIMIGDKKMTARIGLLILLAKKFKPKTKPEAKNIANIKE